jgi:hypothetical protein
MTSNLASRLGPKCNHSSSEAGDGDVDLFLADHSRQLGDTPLVPGHRPVLSEDPWPFLQERLLPGTNGVRVDSIRPGHLFVGVATLSDSKTTWSLNFGEYRLALLTAPFPDVFVTVQFLSRSTEEKNP